jgi:hypothetical protein
VIWMGWARARVTGSGRVHCSATMRRDPARATDSGKVTCSARATGWARAIYSAMVMARARTCSATGWGQVMTCSGKARVTAMCWRPHRCRAGPPAGFRQRSHHRPPWRVPRPTAGQTPVSCGACERLCGCMLRRSSRLLGRMPGRNGSKTMPRTSRTPDAERPGADCPCSSPGRLRPARAAVIRSSQHADQGRAEHDAEGRARPVVLAWRYAPSFSDPDLGALGVADPAEVHHLGQHPPV